MVRFSQAAKGVIIAQQPIPAHLRLPVGLTRAGLFAERATQAFWPFWTILFFVLAPLVMGWQDMVPGPVVLGFVTLSVAALGATVVRGLRRFTWPTQSEAMERVDSRLPGRPLAALADHQAIGAGDSASEAVWQTHMRRMAERSFQARPVEPDLRLARRDPFGLRYIGLLSLVVAMLFGSVWRVTSVAEAGGGGVVVTPAGPSWEGWVEPPGYTGKPTLYLADVMGRALTVPQGAMITVRLYDEEGGLSIEQTVAAPQDQEADAEAAVQNSFEVVQSGQFRIEGAPGASWRVIMEPDLAPDVVFAGPVEVQAGGQMAQPFKATDDFGVIAGTGTFALDLARVDRRHGLAAEPQSRDALVVDLPMPFTGDRAEFEDRLIDDFSQHPWANLPVVLTLQVSDALDQTGQSEPLEMTLPGRRFFQPIARAVIEQRRDLLWTTDNATRVAQVLRAISHRPEGFFPNELTHLRLRNSLRQIETGIERGFTEASLEEISEALWDLAVQLEEGRLADALARLERAQERLEEAMRDGASDEEIAELMNELREAMDDYMRMLAENAEPQDGTDQPDQSGERMEFSMDELQALLDRIQELMEEGRMAEAQELMQQLDELLRNMEITQGEGGDGPQMPGEQSMQDLAETLRDQQQLNDDAFRDLQEQFNQGQQPGQEQGQQPGEQPGEQGQDGQQGQGPGQGDNETGGIQDDTGAGGEGGGDTEQSLADRQRGLRDGLNQLRDAIPGMNGEAADRAEEALGRAEGAMEGAEEALREGDFAEAIDRQSEALDALRDGMRNLGEALAQDRRDQLEEGQGTQAGQAEGRPEPTRRDPLGRQFGNDGQFGSDENMLQDRDVYRRAEEILRELRDRSADLGRPSDERDYLERLLDRF